MKQNKTIRFWSYENGSPVKISLKPSQRLNYSKFERTEEGYNYVYMTYEHDGEKIFHTLVSKGRDCDGIVESYNQYILTFENAKGGNFYEGIQYPKWELVAKESRDLYAELAGY